MSKIGTYVLTRLENGEDIEQIMFERRTNDENSQH